MNSGVFFSSSPDLSRELVQRLYPLAISERTWVDQDIVKSGLKNLSYTSCRLPGSFAGHCSTKLNVRLPPPCELVTYHPTCLQHHDDKLSVMRQLLESTNACAPSVERVHSVRVHEKAHCCRMQAQQVLPILSDPPAPRTIHVHSGVLRRIRHAPHTHSNATIEWCEQQCLDQSDCRYYSYSREKAEQMLQDSEHELVNTLPNFGRPFCSLCAHCDMLPGGTFSSWRMRRDWEDQGKFL
jgi:hypothetical protein